MAIALAASEEALPASGADRAMRVVLPEPFADVAGAILMDLLGPFEKQEIARPEHEGGLFPDPDPPTNDPDRLVALVFYPQVPYPAAAARSPAGAVRSRAAAAQPARRPMPHAEEILSALPPPIRRSGRVRVETYDAPRDWEEGWKYHFRPIVIGSVRVRPPWETASRSLVDVVINPGLGFGTGLHPTTRGALRLLQGREASTRGTLVDVGTGSGVLAIAGAKLGWKPVFAFDNDPVAAQSARENVRVNRVQGTVLVRQIDLSVAPLDWFAGATVLANLTLDPVITLVDKLGSRSCSRSGGRPAGLATGPRRMVVAGILGGDQERALLLAAGRCGFRTGRILAEAGWVSVELFPGDRP